MHHPTYRITHTTAFVTPVVEHWLEREIYIYIHTHTYIHTYVHTNIHLYIHFSFFRRPSFLSRTSLRGNTGVSLQWRHTEAATWRSSRRGRHCAGDSVWRSWGFSRPSQQVEETVWPLARNIWSAVRISETPRTIFYFFWKLIPKVLINSAHLFAIVLVTQINGRF